MRYISLLLLLTTATAFGQAKFSEVDLGVNIPVAESAFGISVADYDNDGDDDLIMAGTPVKLLRNDGDLHFVETTMEAGLEEISAKVSLWFDINNDGWLDLVFGSWDASSYYLSNRDGTFSFQNELGNSKRQAFMAGDLNGDYWPDLYAVNFRQDNDLYVNQNDSGLISFGEDPSQSRLSMGSIMFDFDEDNDLDIYITYDGNEPNELLINDGFGFFTNTSSSFNLDNQSHGMGVDIADFNLDGQYDFYITNLGPNDLLIHNGEGFLELGQEAGVNDPGMGWGTVCFDYNNDGFVDIYTNNELLDYPNQLYKNNGDLTFTNEAEGTILENFMGGYGCATGDFNDDGKLDLVVVNNTGDLNLRVFINEEQETGNWLQLNIVSSTTDKYAIGTRLRAYYNGNKYMQDVIIGSGYKSQNSYRVHFGLGEIPALDSLVIYWTDGTKESYQDIALNQRYLVIQNQTFEEYKADTYFQSITQVNNLKPPYDISLGEIPDLAGISIARAWNELLLDAIRGDYARPTVHARNLFHISLAMYEVWATYDQSASHIFLGQNYHGFNVPFEGVPLPEEKNEAIKKAISFAAFRLISHRFTQSPSASRTLYKALRFMRSLGYNPENKIEDYLSGDPAALGNYIASKLIAYGLQDGANESLEYGNKYYQVVNNPLKPHEPGNPNLTDPNRWQQLELIELIDQSGNEISGIQDFLSPEWGQVAPFALTTSDLTIKKRDGHDYYIYHDPGPPPLLDSLSHEASLEFKWNFELVMHWSAQLDSRLHQIIDISPASIGNLKDDDYPRSFEGYKDFYNFSNADPGRGYDLNPITKAPYEPQMVNKGDYARVLAEFWADGPHSETPPGHWFTILNYVTDHPQFVRKMKGQGDELDLLEWDIKSYLVMGGAMHDAAITAWGIKGYYDYIRPINALRYLADHGQASDPTLENYSEAGITLREGYIEVVNEEDSLAGPKGENVGKIKVRCWKGPDYISNPTTDMAGVGWILAENWWPYQRPSFVTPPFAGYISGHSTYSRAAAEVLTLLTGSEYFPGGMGEFEAPKNEFLVFEEGPSEYIVLQWAKYRDASDQCSLSRIWGGIHPPADDIPGRIIGTQIGQQAFHHALHYFTGDEITNVSTEEKLKPYPNPLPPTDVLFLRTKENGHIKVYNLNGQVLHYQSVIQGINRLQLTKVNKGMIMIEFTGPSGRDVKKVIVQ